MNATSKKIAIIGGGISGLAAAYQCRKLDTEVSVTLFEATPKLGGVLQTEHVDGFVVEQSADMFTTDPPFALELCRELGKEDKLIQTREVAQRAFVACEDGIHPVPTGLSLMLPNRLDSIQETLILDEEGKKRMLAEQTIPPRMEEDDESLQSFAVRRFGQQAFDRLIQPLVSGIYTADPEKLSMQATLERFRVMERNHGSLIDAAQAKAKPESETSASGARYAIFRAPRNGMGEWVTWLADATPNLDIRLNSGVTSITKTESGWEVLTESGSQEFDALIVTSRAQASAKMLNPVDPELGGLLDSIESASSAIVIFGIDESQLAQKFPGFGIVMPHHLGRKAIALSFSSNKFENRAPDGKMLIRCFIGGALQSELLEMNDGSLAELAWNELNRAVGVSGQPGLVKVFRWNQCMPQYHLGHLERVKKITKRVEATAGLELAGNSYTGVGIPVCLQCGMDAANRTLQYLNTLNRD